MSGEANSNLYFRNLHRLERISGENAPTNVTSQNIESFMRRITDDAVLKHF